MGTDSINQVVHFFRDLLPKHLKELVKTEIKRVCLLIHDAYRPWYVTKCFGMTSRQKNICC